MLTDIPNIEEHVELRKQVTVIGSGIAGAEVATHLARNGREVLLIESVRSFYSSFE